MADMVILGAGASAEAGVPMAFEMVTRLVEYYDSRACDEPMYGFCAQVLRNVIGALIHELSLIHI